MTCKDWQKQRQLLIVYIFMYAIPYPELVERSREFDLFISCHIQNDPSCTYIETFGSGLPIVGYANTMFQRLSEESQVGFATPIGNPVRAADKVAYLMSNTDLLAVMSRRARAFCLEHVFEKEFSLRVSALKDAYQHV